MNLWTIIHKLEPDENIPHPMAITPMDNNPTSDDDGMLVYFTREAAQKSAEHQEALYQVEAEPFELTTEGIAALREAHLECVRRQRMTVNVPPRGPRATSTTSGG